LFRKWIRGKMSDAPKFEVIDRRKFKAEEEEHESAQRPAEPATAPEVSSGGPQLVVNESKQEAARGCSRERVG